MCIICLIRGFISEDDDFTAGKNSTYYLYTGDWYFMISSEEFDGIGHMVSMIQRGYLKNTWITLEHGGVR